MRIEDEDEDEDEEDGENEDDGLGAHLLHASQVGGFHGCVRHDAVASQPREPNSGSQANKERRKAGTDKATKAEMEAKQPQIFTDDTDTAAGHEESRRGRGTTDHTNHTEGRVCLFVRVIGVIRGEILLRPRIARSSRISGR